MSSRVRCSLEWEGMKYLTNRQVMSAVGQIFRRSVGVYYRKIRAPETPIWKFVAEMWESIPELPESARLKIWREKKGVGKRKSPELRLPLVAPQRRVQQVVRDEAIGRGALRYATQVQTGAFINGNFVPAAPTHIPLPVDPTIHY